MSKWLLTRWANSTGENIVLCIAYPKDNRYPVMPSGKHFPSSSQHSFPDADGESLTAGGSSNAELSVASIQQL